MTTGHRIRSHDHGIIGKQNSKIVIINIFGNLSKKKLLTSILALIFEKNVEDIAIIDANAYYLVY